jgi:hypothetical protein
VAAGVFRAENPDPKFLPRSLAISAFERRGALLEGSGGTSVNGLGSEFWIGFALMLEAGNEVGKAGTFLSGRSMLKGRLRSISLLLRGAGNSCAFCFKFSELFVAHKLVFIIQ